jgi:hypothetical protein
MGLRSHQDWVLEIAETLVRAQQPGSGQHKCLGGCAVADAPDLILIFSDGLVDDEGPIVGVLRPPHDEVPQALPPSAIGCTPPEK